MTTKMATPIPTIVYLTEADPFDQTQGASIKSLVTIKALCQHYRVHVLFVRRTLQPASTRLPNGLKNLSTESVYIPDIDKPIKKRLLWLLINYLHLEPHHFAAYASATFSNRLAAIIATLNPTYIWADHLRMARYWNKQLEIPLILESHNIEWRLLYDCYQMAPKLGHWHHLVWLAEALFTKAKETWYLQQSKTVLAISTDDAREMQRLVPNKPVLIYPPLLSLQAPKNTDGIDTKTTSLLFVGNLDWYPNADALKYFITQIWPLISHTKFSVELHVVGQPSSIFNFTDLISQQSVKTIFLHHKQPNLEPFYQHADMVILPFRIAGGVRIKALEAIQHHKPIVTTVAGCKGLPTTELSCQLPWVTADTPNQFAQAIERLATTQHRSAAIKQTQRYAKAYCDWATSKIQAISYFNLPNE